MEVYVYLYENGKMRSFDHLSGPEGDAIEESLEKYGNLFVYTNKVYAVMEDFKEAKFNEAKKNFNERFVITPKQPRGSKKWGEVKVEFRTTELDPKMKVQEAGRRRRKVTSKKAAKKTCASGYAVYNYRKTRKGVFYDCAPKRKTRRRHK